MHIHTLTTNCFRNVFLKPSNLLDFVSTFDTNLPDACNVSHILVSSVTLKSCCLYSFYLRFEQTLACSWFLAHRRNELHPFILFLRLDTCFYSCWWINPKGRNLCMLQWALGLAHHPNIMHDGPKPPPCWLIPTYHIPIMGFHAQNIPQNKMFSL